MTSITPQERWWEPFYDELLAETLLVRESAADVDATLDFIVEKLQLDSGRATWVLDQCCGIGSLASPLARRGFQVFGVDQSSAYIERARKEGPPGATFAHGDAGTVRPGELCVGGFNWWTSYGYAATRDENRAMLRGAAASLAPGARFMLDTMNLAGVLRGFEETTRFERSTPMGVITVERQSQFDLASGRLLKHWTYLAEGKEIGAHDSSLMLSMPHDLGADLTSAGFEVEAYYGGVDGRPLHIDDPRCIVLARKPHAP